MRVERDRITGNLYICLNLIYWVLVRVGGGYLSIDEFLDIYTPMELERLDRNDPVKRFSEKVAV